MKDLDIWDDTWQTLRGDFPWEWVRDGLHTQIESPIFDKLAYERFGRDE